MAFTTFILVVYMTWQSLVNMFNR